MMNKNKGFLEECVKTKDGRIKIANIFADYLNNLGDTQQRKMESFKELFKNVKDKNID